MKFKKTFKEAEMKNLLSGVRILDLSQAIAGPFGSMILGDLGAEVIKIEAPEGDISRFSSGPTYEGENFFYLAFNRNKKDVVLDLRTKLGKEAFCDLVKISDIVWNNFRSGVMSRLGIDYNTLNQINPKIILCSISGYGQSGPDSQRPSYDIVTLAETGLLSITGEPGGRPARPGAPIADLAAGIFAVIGVLSALFQRQLTGKGQEIDISLQDSCLALLAYQFSYYFCSGKVPSQESFSGHINSAPYGVFKTKKGYLALGACWPRITRAISADWLADDPRFQTRALRVENRNELNAIVEEHLGQAEADDWLEIFKIDDIPAAKVKTLDEVIRDPQVLHRNMILSMEHPHGGNIRLIGNPIKMGSITEEDFTPPPLLNQDGGDIFSNLLGYSLEKITKLQHEQENNVKTRLTHVKKAR